MWLGLMLLAASLLILCSCLVLLVKVLKSILRGKIVKIVKKVVNAEFCGAGYLALFAGAVMTMLVQSSSIFTSVLTPLVGMNVIKLECMYPLTLGSNIGTTATGLLAAMAASGDKLEAALQIALVHLCFNVTGILLFYPIPHTRIPIRLAKMMGNTTAKYRWFAAFYLVMMFVVLPLAVFGISMAGSIPLAVFLCVVMSVATLVIILNVLQRKIPERLPEKFRTWEFLPFKWMHSLEPLDGLISKVCKLFRRCCPCCCKKVVKKPEVSTVEETVALTEDLSGPHRIFPDYITSSPKQTIGDKSEEKKSSLPSSGPILAEEIEKKLASEAWGVESGYGSRDVSQFASRVPTPNNTATNSPSESVLPSRTVSRTTSILDIKEEKL